MKYTHKWLSFIALAGILSVTGCSASGTGESAQQAPKEEVQSVNQMQPDLKTGVNSVLQEVQKLENYLKTSSQQEMINKFGKEIAKKWDAFEEDVEEAYPDQYSKIEANLYPLIAETGKQQLDIAKIQELVKKVQEDLKMFLKQLQS